MSNRIMSQIAVLDTDIARLEKVSKVASAAIKENYVCNSLLYSVGCNSLIQLNKKIEAKKFVVTNFKKWRTL